MTALEKADNPIVWQEINHQKRATPHYVRRWWFVAPLVVIIMIITVLTALSEMDYPTRETALYMIWIVNVVAAVRAIAAGANAISREHVGQTWDALILTGISARQILFGKWRAALERAAPSLLALGAIRLVMIPVFMYALMLRYAWWSGVYIGNTNYSNQSYSDTIQDIWWVPWAALLAVVASLVLTALEILGCTALGLAASAVTRRGIAAMITALSIRFAFVAVFGGFTRYELGGGAGAYQVLRFSPFAIADAGSSSISRLSVPYTPWSIITHTDALYGLFLATSALIFLLVGSLAVAWIAIRLNGALPHPRNPAASERLSVSSNS